MKTYLTRAEALRRYPLNETELDELLAANQLDAIMLVDNGDKHLAFYDDSLAAYIAERDIAPAAFDHLRGNLLGVAEAARKYKKAQGTISRWVQQGNLKVRGYDKNKKLVDEADVAYLIAMGRAKKIRPGKKVFN